jgi:hypothetical protein
MHEVWSSQWKNRIVINNFNISVLYLDEKWKKSDEVLKWLLMYSALPSSSSRPTPPPPHQLPYAILMANHKAHIQSYIYLTFFLSVAKYNFFFLLYYDLNSTTRWLYFITPLARVTRLPFFWSSALTRTPEPRHYAFLRLVTNLHRSTDFLLMLQAVKMCKKW